MLFLFQDLKKGRIIENLDAWNVKLSDDEFKTLEEALDALEIHGHRGINEYQGMSIKDWGKGKESFVFFCF